MSMIQRVAAKHMGKKASVALGEISDAANTIEDVNEMLHDVVQSLENGTMGFEAPADAIGEVAKVVNVLRAQVSRTLGDAAKTLKGVVKTHQRLGAAAVKKPSTKMDTKTKSRVAVAFQKVGLDGNKRFEKPDYGYMAAVEALRDFDIELDGIAHSHLFQQAAGQQNIQLAWTNHEDSFSPVPIPNSVLVLAWHRDMPTSGKYEVTAYLS